MVKENKSVFEKLTGVVTEEEKTADKKVVPEIESEYIKKLEPVAWFIGRTGTYLILYLLSENYINPDITDTALSAVSLNDLIKTILYYAVLVVLIGKYFKGFSSYGDTKEIWSGIGWLLLSVIAMIFIFGWYQNSSNKPIESMRESSEQGLYQPYAKAIKIPISSSYQDVFGTQVKNYNLVIPTNTISVCTWSYSGGSAMVPYSKNTTSSRTHFLSGVDDGSYYDYKVTCTDGGGNRYEGVFY